VPHWIIRSGYTGHWGGLLHLVQRWGDWAGPQPAQAPPRCTKCNSPPINGQCTNNHIYNGPLLCGFNLPVKGLTYRHIFFTIWSPNHSGFPSIKHLSKILTGSPRRGCWMQLGGVYKFRDFRPISGDVWTAGPQLLWKSNRKSEHSMEPWHFRWPLKLVC